MKGERSRFFPVSSEVPKFWFQNMSVFSLDPKIKHLNNPVWSGDPMWPARPYKLHTKQSSKIQTLPSGQLLKQPWGWERFWNQHTHLAPRGFGWVYVCVHTEVSEDSNCLGIRASWESSPLSKWDRNLLAQDVSARLPTDCQIDENKLEPTCVQKSW